MGMNAAFRNGLGSNFVGSAIVAKPASWIVGLATAAGDAYASGLTVVEASGGYADVTVTNDGSGFDVSGGVIENVATVAFTDPTSSWGTVTAFFISSEAGASGAVAVGTIDSIALDASKAPVRFLPGTLKITVADGS